MSHQITIESLPDEMLMCIFRHLDWVDFQSAMLVCQRWASARASVAVLKIHMNECIYDYDEMRNRNMLYSYNEVINALCQCQTPYRHVLLIWNQDDDLFYREDDDNHCEFIRKNILKRFRTSVQWLKICCSSTSDPSGVIFDRQLEKVLRLFPNLKHLDMDGVFIAAHGADSDELWENPGRIKLKPMSKLRSLHAGGDFEESNGGSLLEVVQNLPDVFAKLTTLHAVIHKDGKHLEQLIRKLGSRLMHLKLYHQEEEPFTMFPNADLPKLETFEVICVYEMGDISDDHLGQFVKRAPKLKVLKLEPFVGIHTLKRLDSLQGSLRCLRISPQTFDSNILQAIVNLSNLKDLELSLYDNKIYFRRLLKKCPTGSQSIRKLKLQSENARIFNKLNPWFYRDCFPNLTELELEQTDLQECLSLANHLPLLERLIVYIVNNVKPKPFLEFCSNLRVPELEIKGGIWKGSWHSSASKALFLRKLIIHADQIDAGVYVPMIESMPALRKLELNLTNTCESKILRTLAVRFPSCDVVRKYRSKFRDPSF